MSAKVAASKKIVKKAPKVETQFLEASSVQDAYVLNLEQVEDIDLSLISVTIPVEKEFKIGGKSIKTIRSVLCYNDQGQWKQLYFQLPQMNCYQSYSFDYVQKTKISGVQVCYPIGMSSALELTEKLVAHIRKLCVLNGISNCDVFQNNALRNTFSNATEESIDELVKNPIFISKEKKNKNIYLSLKGRFDKRPFSFTTKYYDPPRKGSKIDVEVSPEKYLHGETDPEKHKSTFFSISPVVEVKIVYMVSGQSNNCCFPSFILYEGYTSKPKLTDYQKRLTHVEREPVSDEEEEVLPTPQTRASKDDEDESEQLVTGIKKIKLTKTSEAPKLLKPKKTIIAKKAAPLSTEDDEE